MKPWKRIEPTETHSVGWRTVVSKRFVTPDGRTSDWQVFNAEGTRCVGVVALTGDRRVIVARQFRPGPEQIMDELPGGIVDSGETPQAAAVRELQEETGYRPGRIEPLGVIHKDGYSNTAHHYFLATDCTLAGEQALDEHEHIEVRLLGIDAFLQNARAGRMTDTAAVFLAQDKLTT